MAMGCECEVVVSGKKALREELADEAIARIHELDAKWSRFRTDSEITKLNFAAGSRHEVSDDTMLLVESLIGAWQATSGAFDPTLLPVLVQGGYQVSRHNPMLRTVLPLDAKAPGRPADIRIYPEVGEVMLPRGTTLDPGGLGKGLAADLVATEVMAGGATGVMIDIGGDLRVMGDPAPKQEGWEIRLSSGVARASARNIRVVDGGVATTNRLRRPTTRVPIGGLEHDLIDPQSLRDSRTTIASVSVVSATAGWSEAISKVPFVLGMEWGAHRLKALGVAAVFTTSSGVSWATPAWDEFERKSEVS